MIRPCPSRVNDTVSPVDAGDPVGGEGQDVVVAVLDRLQRPVGAHRVHDAVGVGVLVGRRRVVERVGSKRLAKQIGMGLSGRTRAGCTRRRSGCRRRPARDVDRLSDEAEHDRADGLRQQLEDEGRAAAVGHRDGDVVRLVDLQVGMADGQRPAVAEVADLVAFEAVVPAADRDRDAGDRDGELGDVDDQRGQACSRRRRSPGLVVLLVAVVVGAVRSMM